MQSGFEHVCIHPLPRFSRVLMRRPMQSYESVGGKSPKLFPISERLECKGCPKWGCRSRPLAKGSSVGGLLASTDPHGEKLHDSFTYPKLVTHDPAHSDRMQRAGGNTLWLLHWWKNRFSAVQTTVFWLWMLFSEVWFAHHMDSFSLIQKLLRALHKS